MSSDQELLALAAKAAGIDGIYSDDHPEFGGEWEDPGIWHTDENDCLTSWNPLTDDGDALRLSVKLRLILKVDYENHCAEARYTLPARFSSNVEIVDFDEDEMPATRRAITRAAAEIGRAMP